MTIVYETYSCGVQDLKMCFHEQMCKDAKKVQHNIFEYHKINNYTEKKVDENKSYVCLKWNKTKDGLTPYERDCIPPTFVSVISPHINHFKGSICFELKLRIDASTALIFHGDKK